MFWTAYIIIAIAALFLLIIILFAYYEYKRQRLHRHVKRNSFAIQEALPKLYGGKGNPWIDKMDKMFQDSNILSEYPDRGFINFDAPYSMATGKKYRIKSEIIRNKKNWIEDIDSKIIYELPVSDVMSCKLSGDAFFIFSINNETQRLFGNELTTWQWDIVPLKAGYQYLMLRASIHIKEGNDVHLKDVPVFERPVIVDINTKYHVKQFFIKNWQWLIGTLVGSGLIWQLLKNK